MCRLSLHVQAFKEQELPGDIARRIKQQEMKIQQQQLELDKLRQETKLAQEEWQKRRESEQEEAFQRQREELEKLKEKLKEMEMKKTDNDGQQQQQQQQQVQMHEYAVCKFSTCMCAGLKWLCLSSHLEPATSCKAILCQATAEMALWIRQSEEPTKDAATSKQW